jgi:CTP synthase (UTP-ammonia lyase)
VLGLPEAHHEEIDAQASCLVISQLTCSLVGQTQTITLVPGSRVHRIYKAETISTHYFCNYGLNPAFRDTVAQSELAITGIGVEGEVRVIELPRQRFFLATLFLPQVASTPEQPDALIVAYLEAAAAFQRVAVRRG